MSRLIVCATILEIEPYVRGGGQFLEWLPFGGGSLLEREGHISILVTGVGKTNSAMSLTRFFLTRGLPGEVINVGIAGGWAEAGVEMGDVVIATEDIYADEGVQTDNGFRTMEDMGFPLLTCMGISRYHRFPLPHGKAIRDRIQPKVTERGHAGPLVTVSTCSGSRSLTGQRWDQFRPMGESMEGAALAHVAEAHGVRFTGIRGISNLVGVYDKSGWSIGDAIRGAIHCLSAYLEG